MVPCQKIESLINNSKNINHQNRKKETALMEAVKSGSAFAVELLLKRPDINIDIENIKGETAIMLACLNNYRYIFNILSRREDLNVFYDI